MVEDDDPARGNAVYDHRLLSRDSLYLLHETPISTSESYVCSRET